jgi:hypothetical protein
MPVHLSRQYKPASCLPLKFSIKSLSRNYLELSKEIKPGERERERGFKQLVHMKMEALQSS